MAESARRIFLRAEWRQLAMLNYEIDPALLARYVPAGTELDFFRGRCYVTMVGFLFLKTRVRGFWIPFHENFEEVNLRFYVKRKAEDGWRRGAVFIKEIVPRWAIASVARNFYNEQYSAMPMRSEISEERVAFHWKSKRGWNSLAASELDAPAPLEPGSEEEFITEHYWGYSGQRDGGSMEYQVLHPSWLVRRAGASKLECDIEALYGNEFMGALSKPPASAFVAEGSPVTVSSGQRI